MTTGIWAAGLEFKIADDRIEWEQCPATLNADAVIAIERGGTDASEAAGWLREYLTAGSRPATQIIAQARYCGISPMTLRRAKAALGVRVSRHGFKKGESHFTWSLKDNVTEDVLETLSIYEKN